MDNKKVSNGMGVVMINNREVEKWKVLNCFFKIKLVFI